MPETVDEAAARILKRAKGGASPALGTDLSKAGPVAIPAGIPPLPPVGPAPALAAPPAEETVDQAAQRILSRATQRATAPSTTVAPRGRIGTPEADDAYNQYEAAARAKGYNPILSSGYRSPEQQQPIWDRSRPTANPNVRIQPNGRPVAKPGFSEHQQGHAFDGHLEDAQGHRIPLAAQAEIARQYGFEPLAGDPGHFTYRGKTTSRPDAASLLNSARSRYADLGQSAAPQESVDDAAARILAKTKPTPAPTPPAPNDPAQMRQYVSGARVNATGTRPGTHPTTEAQMRGDVYGPVPPGVVVPARQQRATDAVFGPNTYDPLNKRERRALNPLENVAAVAGRMGSMGLSEQEKQAREFQAQQVAGKQPRYLRLSDDPKVRARQAEELKNLQDTIDIQFSDQLEADSHTNVRTFAPRYGFGLGVPNEKLTPWQQANLPAAVAYARYHWDPQNKSRIDKGLVGDLALLGAGEALAPVVAGAPIIGRLAAKAGKFAPLVEHGATGLGIGVPTGAAQGILAENLDNPNASAGDYFRAGGVGALAGGGLGLGLGLATGGGAALLEQLGARRAAATQAAEDAVRAQARSHVQQQRAARLAPPPQDAIRTTAPAMPESRLPVDRHPTTGQFTPAGEGLPAHRAPTLQTEAGPVPIRKGLPVEVQGKLSPGTRFIVERVEGQGEGAVVHLTAPNGMKAQVLARTLKEARPVTPESAAATIRPTPAQATPVASPRLSGPSLPVVTTGEVSAVRPPRDPLRVSVTVDGVPKEAQLAPEQLPRWQEMDAAEKQAAQRVADTRRRLQAAPVDSPERIGLRGELDQANRAAKGLAMANAAERRQMTGLLTVKEQQAAEREAGVLRAGRPVTSPQGKGTVVSPPAFGKVRVRLQDGREVSVPAGETTVIREGAPSTRERMQQLRDQAVQSGQAAPSAEAPGKPAEKLTAAPEALPATPKVPKAPAEVTARPAEPATVTPKPEPVAEVPKAAVQPPEATAHPLVTPEGHIRLPGETKPPIRRVLSERTDDLIQAHRILDGIDDAETQHWSENAPLARQDAAFRHAADPQIESAVREVQRQRERIDTTDTERGVAAGMRDEERRGLRGRPLVQEVHHYGDPITHTEGGKTYRYRGIQPEYQRPELLQDLYDTVNTNHRDAAMFPTPHGRMSLRDLIFEGKMLPADVATTGGKIKAPAIHAKLDEAEAAALARLKSRRGRVSSGIDPEDLADLAVVGASRLAKGVVKFTEWSAEMLHEFGERVRPHLEAIWKQAHAHYQDALPVNVASRKDYWAAWAGDDWQIRIPKTEAATREEALRVAGERRAQKAAAEPFTKAEATPLGGWPGFRRATDEEWAAAKGRPDLTHRWVNEDPNGSLVARGKDEVGRWQRKYQDTHHEAAAVRKFTRLRDLAPRMPDLLRRTAADFRAGGRNREEALVARVVAKTGMRIGGEAETGGAADAFGATTLAPDHVIIEGNDTYFRFPGKGGHAQEYSTSDPLIAAEMRRRKAEGGDRLFRTTAEKTRAYLKDATGIPQVKNHDLRTYNATRAAAESIAAQEPPANLKEFKERRLIAEAAGARQINDDIATARKHYIDPSIFNDWQARVEEPLPAARRPTGQPPAATGALRDDQLPERASATGGVERAAPRGLESAPAEPKAAGQLSLALDNIEAAARTRLKSRSGRLRSGIDPEDLADYTVLGAVKIARGAVKFGEWSAQMVRDFGDEIKPHLQDLWQRAQAHHDREFRTLGENSAKPTPEPIVPRRPTTTSTTPPARPKYAGSINLDRLNTSEEVVNHLLQQAQAQEPAITRQRRGTISLAETEAAARELGMTVDQVRAIRPGKALNAEEITALRGIHLHAREEALAAARAFAESDSTENLLRFEKANRELEVVHQALQGASSEAGRALSAHRIAARALEPAVTVESVLAPEHAPKDALPPSPPRRTSIARPVTEPPAPAGRPAATRTLKPAPAPKPVFGEANRVFTLDRAAAARARILAKAGRLGSGVPVDILPDVLELGGFYAEAGLRTFGKWSAQMRADLGEKVLTDAQLRSVWDRLKPETTKRVREVAQRDAAMSRVLDSLGGREELAAKAKALAAIGDDPVAVAKYVQSQSKPTFIEKATGAYKAQLTMGPPTHARNFASTMTMVATQTPERALASLFEIPISKLQKRAPEFTLRDTAAGAIAGIKSGVPTGLQRARETMQHGFTVEQARALDLPTKHVEWRGGLANPYNSNPRLMGAEDQFFKGIAYENARSSLAMREAMREGLKGEALGRRATALLEDEGIIQKAEEAAKYYTFNSEPTELTKKLLGVRKALGPVGQLILPFVNTPANVARNTYHLSPFGLARLFNTGVRNTPGEVSRVLAQASLGTMAWLTAAHVVSGTDIVGAAPDAPGAKDAFYASKRRPYTLKIGNHWVSYSGLGPITQILATVAATKDDFWTKGEATPLDRFGKVTATAVKAFSEQSFLSGLTNIVDAIQDPKREFETWAAQQATGVLPLSGFLRFVANATDDTQRAPQGIVQRVQQSLPGANRLLPPRIDAFGEESKRDPSGLAAAQPFVGGPENPDPVRKELMRLKAFPSPPTAKVKVGDKDVTLNQDQLTGLQKAVGAAVKARATTIINSAYYKGLTDEKRANRLDDELRKAGQRARTDYLRSVGIHVQRRGSGSGIGFGGF